MQVKISRGDDGTIEEIFAKFESLDFIEVDAGYLNSEIEHPGTGTSLVEIATIQQFGSDKHNIPSRPFISDGAILSQKSIQESIQEVFFNYFKLKIGMKSFSPIEKISRESIAKAIAEQKFVRLKDETLRIRREKGNYSEKILIDEAYLINGIESNTTRRRSKNS